MKKPHALIGLLAALGTAIGVIVAIVGLPYGRLNYTAFAGLYHNGTAFPSVQMEVDCDTGTVGVQNACTIPVSNVAPIPVDVIASNFSAATVTVDSFNYDLYNPQCMTGCVNGNTVNIAGGIGPSVPVQDATNFPPSGVSTWGCSSPPALADTGLGATGTSTSFLSCVLNAGVSDSVTTGSSLRISGENFSDSVTAPTTFNLTLSNVAMADDNAVTILSCDPAAAPPASPEGNVSGPCFPAALTFLIPPATNTPVPPTATNTPVPPTSTNTATATNTATNTPTATATSSAPSQDKQCDTNLTSTNVGPGPSCNLFICQVGPCAGAGEGDLIVIENVHNVSTTPANLGLGAYEFNVEFDSFVIASVNPQDIIFTYGCYLNGTPNTTSCGTAPATSGGYPAGGRGVPDCSMTILFESSVRFGCVTHGSAAGPAGSFELAYLDLVPAADDVKDMFPGNNNGIPTLIKDNQCELADTLGHPVKNSTNGAGLIPTCGDIFVTIRILEGDMNLDCVVNLADEAIIAQHYGAFFGSAFYNKWFDLEPSFHDLDVDIKDVQKVFGREGSTCQNPIPAQTPVAPPAGWNLAT